ncbi:hypothetical protein CH289_21780 [Rhodococcus sp. RS1C4]|nr:hypothetical protein CH289_21780 [Rhodococcus sp. RS1C4]
MAHYINDDDPYELWQLRVGNEQINAPTRTANMTDGRVLRTWVTRPELSPELFEYVEGVLGMSRHDERFPQPGELCTPSFHADLALPNLTPRDTWEYMRDPEQLAESLQREEGVTVPVSMLQDLHADSTVARYGDLHVDHFGAVVQMESLKRDAAALGQAETPDSAIAARTHLAVLQKHHQTLLADLDARRQETNQRHCLPYELIAAQSEQWIRDTRIRELKSWPGGEHAARAAADFDRLIIANKPSFDPQAIDDPAAVRALKDNFSNIMSQARIREWGDQSRPSAVHPLSPEARTLTEADRRVCGQAKNEAEDRGIRREPKRPVMRANDNEEHQRHQYRMNTATQAERRRPSM